MPYHPTLTSSSVHHSSHQLTTTFLSYYNVTRKIICAEKWRKAMIYYTTANTWHSPNAVSMLTHSLWRLPNIGTALGACPVLSGFVMRVTLHWWRFIPRVPLLDNTIHWPNADVMMGHRLWGCANIIPTKTLEALITNIIVNIIFS